VRIRKELYEEAVILVIAGSSHIGKVLFKQQHERFAVIVLSITMPLVLVGIVVLHLEQDLVHLSKVRAVLLVDLINDNCQRVPLLLSASCLASNRPEALRGAFQLDSALKVLFQAIVLQENFVIDIRLVPSALGQHGIKEFRVDTELMNFLIKQAAYLRDKSIDSAKSSQCGLEKFLQIGRASCRGRRG